MWGTVGSSELELPWNVAVPWDARAPKDDKDDGPKDDDLGEGADIDDVEFDEEFEDELIDLDDEYDTTGEEERHPPPGHGPRRYDE